MPGARLGAADVDDAAQIARLDERDGDDEILPQRRAEDAVVRGVDPVARDEPRRQLVEQRAAAALDREDLAQAQDAAVAAAGGDQPRLGLGLLPPVLGARAPGRPPRGSRRATPSKT